MKNQFLHKLKGICADLIYISETDSAVNPFYFEKVESIEKALGETSAREFSQPFDEFDAVEFLKRKSRSFDTQTHIQEKYAEKFAAIQFILKSFGSSIKGLRFGTVAIEYFIFSENEGQILGVHFRAVET